MKSVQSSKNWVNFVDTATIAWLGLFVIGFLAFDTDLFCLEDQAIVHGTLEDITKPFCSEHPPLILPDELEQPIYIINWIIWIVFVIDLIFKYMEISDYKLFLRKHWFDIILVIPFFRILSIFKIF